MQQKDNHDKVFAVGLVLIVLIIVWFLAKPFFSKKREKNLSMESQSLSEDILKAPSLSAEDLLAKLKRKEKINIFDLRDSGSYEAGHIETSELVSPEKLGNEYLESLGIEKTSDIILIGFGDDIAQIARLTNGLVETGFVNARYLEGGIDDWRSRGFSVVTLNGPGTISEIQSMSLEEIESEADFNPDSIQFVDLREKGSFENEHIVRAINIPLAELEKRSGEVPTNKKVIVYGQEEKENTKAVAILFNFNFFNVYRMEGSFEDWKNAGGKVE